jgi:hypothetical protein
VEMEVNFILKLDQVTNFVKKRLELEVLGIERCTSQDQIVGSIQVSKFRSKVPFQIRNWTTLVINHYAMNYTLLFCCSKISQTIMFLAPWESAQ